MILDFLVLSVGQACNLKCKNCGNFAPYAPKENLRYDFDDIKRDLLVILKHIDELKHIQIQGGEPLLYPELDRVILFLGGWKKSLLSRSQLMVY